MSTVSLSLPSDGSTADVADYNTPITTLANEFNGNIDNANIKAAAAIDGSKIADDTIVAGKIVGIDKSNLTTDSNPYKFRVSQAAAANTGNNAYAVVAFDTEQYDTNNNVAAGVFTAPVAGFYQFNWNLGVTLSTGTSETFIATLFINGGAYSEGGLLTHPGTATSALQSCHGSDTVQMAAGQTADIRAYAPATRALSVGIARCYFSGHLVSRT